MTERMAAVICRDESVLSVIRNVLETEKLGSHVFEDVSAFFGVEKTLRPDILVVDARLLGRSAEGVETFVETVRQSPAWFELPLLFLAADVRPVQRCLLRDKESSDVVELSANDDLIKKKVCGLVKLVSLTRALRQMEQELSSGLGFPRDPATGLPEWNAFKHVVSAELHRARRYDLPLTFVFLAPDVADVPEEKVRQVNQALGATLIGAVRRVDMLGTCLGSFLILLPMTPVSGATIMGERAKTALEEVAARHVPMPVTSLVVDLGALRSRNPVALATFLSRKLAEARKRGAGSFMVWTGEDDAG